MSDLLEVVLPAQMIIEGTSTWGFLRVCAFEQRVYRIDIQVGADPTKEQWTPFVTMTVHDGKLLFNINRHPMHGGTLATDGTINRDSESSGAGSGLRLVEASAQPHPRPEGAQGDDPAVRTPSVGKDAQHPDAGQAADPRD